MFQAAFDTLKAVEAELATVNETLDARRFSPACVGSERALVNTTRAQSERTYLLRLLSDFEGALARLGPFLSPAVTFTNREGLDAKLNRIGRKMGMPAELRADCGDRLRDHRNELAHGRSPVPRVSFDSTLELMKAFLRNCR